MTEHDPFSTLWQQQKVTQVDGKKLQAQWRSTRIKQRSYFALDVVSTLSMPAMMYYLYDSLNRFAFLWWVSVMMLSFGFLAYVVWLRRYALRPSKEQLATQGYLEQLQLQYQQNVKLARVSKLSVWALPFLLLTFLFGNYLVGEFESEALWRKLSFLTLFMALFMPAVWFWANKREQKYLRALEQIKTVIADH